MCQASWASSDVRAKNSDMDGPKVKPVKKVQAVEDTEPRLGKLPAEVSYPVVSSPTFEEHGACASCRKRRKREPMWIRKKRKLKADNTSRESIEWKNADPGLNMLPLEITN